MTYGSANPVLTSNPTMQEALARAMGTYGAQGPSLLQQQAAAAQGLSDNETAGQNLRGGVGEFLPRMLAELLGRQQLNSVNSQLGAAAATQRAKQQSGDVSAISPPATPPAQVQPQPSPTAPAASAAQPASASSGDDTGDDVRAAVAQLKDSGAPDLQSAALQVSPGMAASTPAPTSLPPPPNLDGGGSANIAPALAAAIMGQPAPSQVSDAGSGGAPAAQQQTGAQNAPPYQTSTLQPQQAAPPNPQTAPGFPGPASAVSPQTGPSVSPADRDQLIRMVYGEARGEPLQGQQATAAVALNRSIASGQPLAQIVNAHGQFEGMKVGAGLDANSPDYQRIAAAVDPLLSGRLPDPSGGATYFYSPAAQAALGRKPPAWDNGTGQQIGGQLFFNHPFASQGAQAPGSFQVASNGPISMPSSASAQLPQQAASQGQAQAGGVPAGVNPMAATPGEIALVQRLQQSSNPEDWTKAHEMALQIQERMAGSPGFDPRYDASTGQTTYTSKTPGAQDYVQQAPTGWRAPLATGMQYNAAGVAAPTPGTSPQPMTQQQRAQWGISPTDRNVYGLDANGKPVKLADGVYSPASYGQNSVSQIGPDGKLSVEAIPGAWTPAQVMEARNNVSGSKPVVDAREAMANYGALQQLALQPGGTKAYAFRDALARIFNPGGIARTNQIELLTHAAGVPDAVKQYFGSLTGDGDLDPRIAQQGLDAAYAFAKSRADQVNGMNASNAGLARRHGLDPQDLSVDLDPLGAPVSLPGQRSAFAPPAPASTAPQPGQRLSPQQAAALPSGTPFTGLDGVQRVKR